MKSVILVISFTSNNIIYTVTDIYGNTLFWTTAAEKTSGIKKLTSVTVVSPIISLKRFFSSYNISFVHLKLIGVGKYKKVVLKILKRLSVRIFSVQDKIILAHNGCKRSRTKKI